MGDNPPDLNTTCCVVGGGPAGMMLGYLLGRAGVDVAVLEKHSDFLRDFRGDTIHPSTLEVMHGLGLVEGFLERPHQKVYRLKALVGGKPVTVADFSHLPLHHPYIAFMPQWDFLDFLAARAEVFPNFKLIREAEVTDLLFDDLEVVGVRAKTPEGTLRVRADLVVGADGRRSVVRDKAGLEVIDLGAPMDALWMAISREAGDPAETMGRFDNGRIMVMLNRDDYWQCAYVIPKGGFDALRARGIEHFRRLLSQLAPFLGARVNELDDWDKVNLLVVKVDRLKTWWRHGLLCIGDAAHAMSPIGGVGINLAVQDAVAAANLLAEPLREQRCNVADLQKVQRRRELPTRVTQRMQIAAQNNVIGKVLKEKGETPMDIPLPLRLVNRFPVLRRLPARLVGMGFRPEHVNPSIFARE